jgi:hypothetical protein
MVAFSIELQGIQGVLDGLEKLQNRAKRVTIELQRDTALIIQSEVDQVFDSAPSGSSGGSVYGGVTWTSLTEAYMRRRPDRASGQLLRDTGELLQSLAVGGSGNILTSDADSLTFGTALPKAGGLRGKRDFLFVTDTMTELIAKRWESFIVEGR